MSQCDISLMLTTNVSIKEKDWPQHYNQLPWYIHTIFLYLRILEVNIIFQFNTNIWNPTHVIYSYKNKHYIWWNMPILENKYYTHINTVRVKSKKNFILFFLWKHCGFILWENAIILLSCHNQKHSVSPYF